MITVGNDLVRNHLHAERGWFLLLGISLVLLGLTLLGILSIANLAVVYLFGLFMMSVGMLHLLAALLLFRTDTRWFWALFSIFYFLAGYFAFSSPDKTAIVLTSLLWMFLLFAGAARMAYATFLKAMPSWKWTFFSGALTFITGLLIMFIPDAPFWVLGLFLAIDVLFQGINYLNIAAVIKKIPKSSTSISS